MITLALAGLFGFAVHRRSAGEGESGLENIPRRLLGGFIDLGIAANMLGFAMVVCVPGMFVLWPVLHSPFGRILKAIREHVARDKLVAFVTSAAIAGLAGATKATVFPFVSPEDVSVALSGRVILMTLLGGLGGFLSGLRSWSRGKAPLPAHRFRRL